MSAAPLRYLSVHVERDGLNEHRRRVSLDTPRLSLMVATETGTTARPVRLSREQAVALIADLAKALQTPGVL